MHSPDIALALHAMETDPETVRGRVIGDAETTPPDPPFARGEGEAGRWRSAIENSLPPCGGGLGWGAVPTRAILTSLSPDADPPPQPSPTRGEGAGSLPGRQGEDEASHFGKRWVGEASPSGLTGLASRAVAPPPSPVAEALRQGKYPWYDADNDRVKPVWPPRISWLTWIRKKISSILDAIGRFFDRLKFSGNLSIPGRMIATIVLLAGLVAFFTWLLMLWLGSGAGAVGTESGRIRLGTAARVADLPEGLGPGNGDPWAEAERRRAAGDLAGATVCLFAYQLLALDQLGLIRLSPGKTGRHYVQSLRDRDLARSLGATLRLFEDVYYGRRSPAPLPLSRCGTSP